jgi:hypothetical protein
MTGTSLRMVTIAGSIWFKALGNESGCSIMVKFSTAGTRNAGMAMAIVAGAFLAPASAQSSSQESVAMTYDVMVSGMKALEIKYDMDLSQTGYSSRATVDTQGLISFFSDSHTVVGAAGEIVGGKAMPASFTTRTEKSGKQKDFKVRWASDGAPEPHQPPVKNTKTQSEIIESLTAGVVDPLTSVLRLGGGSAEAPCESSQRVYSGRDVFDLSFTLEREVTLGDKADGVYRGPAYECRMVYTPIAGRDAEKARKNKTEPWTVKVWFAPVKSESLNGSMLLPVAASGKINGRKFRAFASKAMVAGEALNKFSSIGN